MYPVCEVELVAYSVQELGGGWRWRVYAEGGRVVLQGMEAARDRAERAARTVFWGRQALLAA